MPTSKAVCWHLLRLHGVGCSSALRYRAGYRKSGRLVRTALRQHARHVFQHRCHRIYHSVGSHPLSGVSTKAIPNATSRKRMNISFILTIAMLGIPFYGYGWTSRTYRHYHCWHCGVYLFADVNKKYPRSGTHFEHLFALHHDDYDRIFLICLDRDPLYRQHSDGPELSGRHLHTGRIPGPRAIWHTPFVLRPGLRLASGTERSGRRMCI